MDRRKDGIIASLWANSNWDDDKGTRAEAIHGIEEQYKEAMLIVHGLKPPPEEEQLDESDPFLRPALLATRTIDVPDGVDPETVAEAMGMTSQDRSSLDQ